MPTDPRLNSLVQFVQSQATGNSQAGVVGLLRSELADQAQRISALERSATVQAGAGAPTQPARDGTLYIDTTANRIYARTLGVWKSVVIA